MAITIQTNPASFASVHGDLLFVVAEVVKTADPVTYPDYRFLADIYIDSELQVRLKSYPQPDNRMGVFNIANIVRDYLSVLLDPTAASLLAQRIGDGEWRKAVQVKFGEEYNFVTYPDITTDTSRTYFGHYNGRLVGNTTILGNYSNKPLTIRPSTTPVNREDKFQFIPYFIQPAGGGDVSSVQLVVRAYTQGGTLQNSYSSSVYSPAEVLEMLVFNIAPTVINAASPGLINDTISYYTVEFVTGDPGAVPSTTLRFNIKCEAKYETFRLHFLNKLSGFESRVFTKVSRKTIDIERSEFGKLGYVMDSSGIVSYKNANNAYYETRSTYASQYKEKMVLNTDNLTDDEYTWLGDLVLSPLVYIEMIESGTSYFIPCVITGNNYEFRKSVNDRLTNLTVNVEFGEQLNAQYR